ncbi:putative spermidine synthase with an N-terminal membrane domain [Sporocytophaga myxococcoides]|uniref:Polyamine aminopropyltransferase n=1 Tax=Sporocytophaga myxococcoides TaxID=153721 RepID=A0A098LD34_9BACT|nr:polyamine aminopropyltransferase [Sporocytophaga myxococcoides]GAL84314.1 putative spermidine synthase with an N-terminal membrane domain [Sporocytophaga myxococcoides]
MPFFLLFSVFVVATCGLIYELIAGTLASYLLGDSVTQFSTIIGVYLFSMGIGSFFSKYFKKNLLAWFIQLEIMVGLIGGTSSTILFLLFEQVESFRFLLYLLVSLTGILVGLEIPLLMRILKNKLEFEDLVSKIFTYDYIGALLASLIFPLVLVPYMGLIKTSFFFGILNVIVATVLCIKFEKEVKWASMLKTQSIAVIILLLAGFVYSENIMTYTESRSYPDKIIYAKSSTYQRIVITKNPKELRLFLNGNLQFSSFDEYRYHEALVHPGIQGLQDHSNVLVLGGGDGLAVRELLKYNTIETITLVDLDGAITNLFKSNHMLLDLNQGSLLDKKVKVINADAFKWLKENNHNQFDFIVIDFPDPSNYSIGKLYTDTFYKLVFSALKENGAAVIQSTSPFVAPQSYWCIDTTIQSVGFKTLPYHAFVPSFGDWGYILAIKGNQYSIPDNYISNLRFLNHETFQQMLIFPKDMVKKKTEINKLNNQAIVHYFEKEWSEYLH